MAKKNQKNQSHNTDQPDELPTTLSPEERQSLHEQQANTGLTPSTQDEPPTEGPYADSVDNPRGIPSNMTSGMPDAQATDSQKVQNPTPKRPPLSASMDPPVTVFERVSAGQNRKPPSEVIP